MTSPHLRKLSFHLPFGGLSRFLCDTRGYSRFLVCFSLVRLLPVERVCPESITCCSLYFCGNSRQKPKLFAYSPLAVSGLTSCKYTWRINPLVCVLRLVLMISLVVDIIQSANNWVAGERKRCLKQSWATLLANQPGISPMGLENPAAKPGSVHTSIFWIDFEGGGLFCHKEGFEIDLFVASLDSFDF